MYLPDINVWLAITFESHGHHKISSAWFDGRTDGSCLFCRYTQSGYLRLSTNHAVFGEEARTLSEAWDCFDALAADSRTAYGREPLGLEHVWRNLTMRRTYSPKVWNDAYLAAFAVAGGLTLATFDLGFREYGGLDAEILT